MKRFVLATAAILTSMSWMAGSAIAASPEDTSYCKRVMYGQERLHNYSPREIAEKRRVCSNLLRASETRGSEKNRHYDKRKLHEEVTRKRESWKRQFGGESAPAGYRGPKTDGWSADKPLAGYRNQKRQFGGESAIRKKDITPLQ